MDIRSNRKKQQDTQLEGLLSIDTVQLALQLGGYLIPTLIDSNTEDTAPSRQGHVNPAPFKACASAELVHMPY